MAKNSRTVPAPVSGPFVLTGSRDELHAALEAQIVAGKSIRDREIKYENALHQAEDETTRWDDYNRTLINQAFTDERKLKEYEYAIGAQRIADDLRVFISNLKNRLSAKIINLESLQKQLPLFQESQEAASAAKGHAGSVAGTPANRNIFLVHGRDHNTRSLVKNVIHEIELKPVILDGEANEGMTVIEKFEKHSGEASYAIVIATGDDEGHPKGKPAETRLRARQNVIGELFYFMAKLGRQRVALLYESGVELPSDIGGLCYIELDSGGAWKFRLARELKAAGFDVDSNRIHI